MAKFTSLCTPLCRLCGMLDDLISEPTRAVSLYFPKTALIERIAKDFNIVFQIDTQKQTCSPRNHVHETDAVEKENYAKLLLTKKMAIQISAET